MQIVKSRFFIDLVTITMVVFVFAFFKSSYGSVFTVRLVTSILLVCAVFLIPKSASKLFNNKALEVFIWVLIVCLYIDIPQNLNFSFHGILKKIHTSSWLYLFYLIILFPIIEEILFRIIPLYNVAHKKVFVAKALIYSFIFAIMHFSYHQIGMLFKLNNYIMLKLLAHFLFGVCMSFIFVMHKSIRLNIITHSCINLLSFLLKI